MREKEGEGERPDAPEAHAGTTPFPESPLESIVLADTRLHSQRTLVHLRATQHLFLPLSPTLAAYRPSTPRSRHYDLSASAKSARGVIDCAVRLLG